MQGAPNTIAVKALCLFVHDGKMLADACSDGVTRESFYRLIGGGVEFAETSEEAVRREIMEELGSGINNLKFLTVEERIFTYNGKQRHQIVFLFQGDLAKSDLYEQERVSILDNNSHALWIPIADVVSGKIVCYPEFDYSTLL